DHPPGLYGPPEGLLAVNALAPDDRLAPLDVSVLTARREAYRMKEPEDLRGPILLGALALLALDALIVFLLAGGIGQLVRRRRRGAEGSAAHTATPRGGAGGPAGGCRQGPTRGGVGAAPRAPPRLRHHRRRRDRPHQQGRAPGPHLVPRATHRARGGRADRAR